ncbi:preprotein translocase subunit SecG [Sphingomonas piscis]|uniref:Protein-export membrane protein SecG n=1 Tax=Sphingomonas piscis TaxID=2714943 RepID=A0A6G7YSQ7_9SPHN|nr:preprotein translocase subunit SecG [Sphingomonas piscis]QIK79773.1 preprotein translocase subunit SecG [Sphingomonas piscis]
MFTFLLIVQVLIATALVAVILMQRSEGGGLGVGGSSSGFMTARGAADFLTRSTAVLGTVFVVLCIAMAAYAGATRKPQSVDTSLANSAGSAGALTRTETQAPAQPADANEAGPVANGAAPTVPLQQ